MFSRIMSRFTLLKHGQINLRFYIVSKNDIRGKSPVYWARSKVIHCRSVSESIFARTTCPASMKIRNLTNVNCHHGNKDADRSVSSISAAFMDINIRSPFNQTSGQGRLCPGGYPVLITNHQSVRGFASRGKKTKVKKERRQRGESTDGDESDGDVLPQDDIERDWDPETDGKMEVEEEVVKDWKDIHQFVPSLRLDAVLGAGLGISRKSVEDAFLSMRLRVNREKVTKKSKQVKEGDILDLILERSTPSQATEGEARNETSVMRIHIKEISADKTGKDRIPVFLRRWKNLLVPKDK